MARRFAVRIGVARESIRANRFAEKALFWGHAYGGVRQHSVLRRVLGRFWEGFWGRVLRRVLRRGASMGFTVKMGSEKGSQKGF